MSHAMIENRCSIVHDEANEKEEKKNWYGEEFVSSIELSWQE